MVRVAIFGIIALLTGLFFLLMNKKAPTQSRDNKWFEITIPSLIKNDEGKKFKYAKKLATKPDGCINREKYIHEFSRIFDFETNDETYKTPQILIIGSHTAIGEALVRKYTKKGVPFTAIKGIYDVDFSFKNSESIDLLFSNMTFAGALVVDQPELERHTVEPTADNTADVLHQYFKGMTRFFERNNISFVVALPRPVTSFVMEKTLKRGGCYVDLPFTVDADAQDDLDHPVMRAVRECSLVKKTTVILHGTEYVQSYTADQAAKFIRKQMKMKKTGHFAIYGASNMTVKEAVEAVVPSKCEVTFKESINEFEQVPFSSQTALVGDENADVRELLKENFKFFQNRFDQTPYASIVVVGRNDNFSKNFLFRAQNFIDSIEENFKKVPLASFELVFVDYAGNAREKHLKETLIIPPFLYKRVRFIEVPLLFHMRLERELKTTVPFLEYIAKNIGIRRSRGEFVITTNPDDILPPDLFEQIAKKQFNKGFLYRAQRWDLREGWDKNYTLKNITDATGSVKTIRSKLDVKERCRVPNYFGEIVSKETFDKNSALCGSGDFIMLSRELWEAVDGFNEYPANPNVDSTFSAKLMRILPGYFRHFVRVPILHQHHPKKNVYRKALPEQEKVMQSYICSGTAKMIDDYPDTPNWGYANEVFKEYRK